MHTISKLRLPKPFIEAPIYSAISFGMPGMSEIWRKKSASVVFCVTYAHCIFSILGDLSFKLSRTKLSLSSVGSGSGSLTFHTIVPLESRTSTLGRLDGLFHSHQTRT